MAERFFGALKSELVLNSTLSGNAGQAHPIVNELPNNGLSCVVPKIFVIDEHKRSVNNCTV